MGTQWPVYAALVLGANIVGAIAVMTFVFYFLPMPEIDGLTKQLPNLVMVGALYLVFAVIVGMIVTFLLFRPVLDWQRNPDEHDPNMVRNLVLRIPSTSPQWRPRYGSSASFWPWSFPGANPAAWGLS